MAADGIRWIATDAEGRLDVDALREQVAADRGDGRLPFLVVATAGSVSTGIVDPLRELAEFWALKTCGCMPTAPTEGLRRPFPRPADLRAIGLADSVALDPHKWLYCPIEAACTLTKDPEALSNAFSFYPEYYMLDAEHEEGINFYQLGMQNSRGFRALKVWLTLRNAGREGYRESIRGDIELARLLFDLADAHPELRAHTNHLSVTTFRYVRPGVDETANADYLNELNKALLAEIQASATCMFPMRSWAVCTSCARA